MFKKACKHDEDIVFYFDAWGNKYVATGGTLAWRLRNPGLIHKRTRAAIANGSIGSYDGFAIFAEPEQGLQALEDWLNSKTSQRLTLQGIAKHYRSKNPDNFLKYLINAVKVPPTKKISDLSKSELENLRYAICKLCGYTYVGDESFVLLPKISAKIEDSVTNEEFYFISGNIVLSKKEAVEWIEHHRLDAVIIHEKKDNNHIHLRSRPYHCMQHIRLNERHFLLIEGQIETLCRSIGEKKSWQCIWGFINGISNSKDDALESAAMISKAANGEQVLSLPNDRNLWTLGNFTAALAQKARIDTPVVGLAVKFFRYLTSLSDQDPKHPPVIIFVHSQGAIITERALEHLKSEERQKLRIFSFGGGSYIAAPKCHPDSINYSSANDPIPKLASSAQQDAYLYYFHLTKKGKTREQIIDLLIERDSLWYSDSESFVRPKHWHFERKKYYEEIFDMHVTIVEPDYLCEHEFKNDCYQKIVNSIVGSIDKNNCILREKYEFKHFV